jgi:hypothetical protein
MKKAIFSLILFGAFLSLSAVSPYLMIGEFVGDMPSMELKISEALKSAGFDVIGKYNPSAKDELRVIVYTSEELQRYCMMNKDRGMLAAALKIGIRNRKGVLQVTMLNPEYLFYAYIREGMENATLKNGLDKINTNAVNAMKGIGGDMTPFGGDLSKDDLKKYKYMMGMPKFDDPVELKEFSSFQDGVNTINKNLASKKGSTVKVFEIIDENKQLAVFGVGLHDQEDGEAHFLTIIGQKHIAAMPYEIILQGNTATILHGRFRFASHWPELTMGTFTKIMSSPGDVEDFLKALTE